MNNSGHWTISGPQAIPVSPPENRELVPCWNTYQCCGPACSKHKGLTSSLHVDMGSCLHFQEVWSWREPPTLKLLPLVTLPTLYAKPPKNSVDNSNFEPSISTSILSDLLLLQHRPLWFRWHSMTVLIDISYRIGLLERRATNASSNGARFGWLDSAQVEQLLVIKYGRSLEIVFK